MGNAPHNSPQATAVGRALKELRDARKWSQEYLAGQLRTNKSQISKRENGHHLPRRETLQKTADVFQLSEPERRVLFERAGYTVERPQRTSGDFRRVVESVHHEWLNSQWPVAVLADVQWRLWHATDSFARVFSLEQAANLTGKHMLELCFDPALGMREALSRVTVEAEIDRFVTHMVARFRSHHSATLSEPWWKELEKRLRTVRRFSEVWDASRRQRGTGSVAALAYLNLVEGGRVIMVGGAARADERFILTLFLPADAHSAHILERTFNV